MPAGLGIEIATTTTYGLAIATAPISVLSRRARILEYVPPPDQTGDTGADAPIAQQDLDALQRKIRSHVKWGRDCGSAAIGAGATVGFSLLLSGSPVRRDVFVPLVAAYGVLLLVAAFFWWRAMYAVGKATASNVGNALAPSVLIVVIALSNLSGGRWPIAAYTGRWWEIVLLAFWVAVTGQLRRRNADDALDDLRVARSAA
jgi:hypothetical protein